MLPEINDDGLDDVLQREQQKLTRFKLAQHVPYLLNDCPLYRRVVVVGVLVSPR